MKQSTFTGNTPFEKAEAGRVRAVLLFTVHQAVKDLVEELNECDLMIDKWKSTVQEYASGSATKEDLEADLLTATQALKDKKLFEEAIIHERSRETVAI